MMVLPEYIKRDVLGSTLTTMKVGGMISYLARVRTLDQIKESIAFAHEEQIPYAFIGSGSNLLFADEGYVGLIIQLSGGSMRRLELEEAIGYTSYLAELEDSSHMPRYMSEDKPGLLQLEGGENAVMGGERVLVEMSAGIAWGQAVAFTLREKLAGLHWYARIPCTVGGAVYNTIHAEHHLLSEVVCAVRTYNPLTAEEKLYGAKELALGYDDSIFHYVPLVITSVIFALSSASLEQANANQALYLGWTQQKSLVQPSGPSAGSVFKNFTLEVVSAKGQQALAAGWYIDKAGLKGHAVGGMKVYPGHANFIINTGAGTQADFRELVTHIRERVFDTFELLLEPEIECWDARGNTLIWPRKIPQ